MCSLLHQPLHRRRPPCRAPNDLTSEEPLAVHTSLCPLARPAQLAGAKPKTQKPYKTGTLCGACYESMSVWKKNGNCFCAISSCPCPSQAPYGNAHCFQIVTIPTAVRNMVVTAFSPRGFLIVSPASFGRGGSRLCAGRIAEADALQTINCGRTGRYDMLLPPMPSLVLFGSAVIPASSRRVSASTPRSPGQYCPAGQPKQKPQSSSCPG